MHSPTSTQTRTRWGLLALLALPVLATCIGLRLHFHDGAVGNRDLTPWPDALEYVAAAQALVDEGRYVLHVGPEVAQPRYPPGVSLLLAPFLWLGMDATELPRLGTLVDSLLCLLLGTLVLLLARRPGEAIQPHHCYAAAGTGLAWALLPLAIDRARYVGSDPVSLLVDLACMGCAAWLSLRRGGDTRERLGLIILGLLLVLSFSLRSANGALMALPLLILLLPKLRRDGVAATLRSLWPLLLSAGLATAAVSYLMLRSGHSAFGWSAYEYWVPEFYGPEGSTFAWGYVDGTRDHANLDDGSRVGYLSYYLRLLLGWPGVAEADLGRYWPLLGWSGFAMLLGRRPTRIIGIAGLSWALVHLLLYAPYFHCEGRMMLGAAAIPVLGLGLLCQRLLASTRREAIPALIFVAGMGAAQLWLGVRQLKHSPHPIPMIFAAATKTNFEPWLQLDAADRAGKRCPINPVYAQARGWLNQAERARIGNWGLLDLSVEHVARLHHNHGLLQGQVFDPKSPRSGR